MHKSTTKEYGHLPPRVAGVFPWRTVAVDLIGPWKIEINGKELEFNALTCIDPVTNLVEIIRIKNKTSRHVANQFANAWLSKYPRPVECIHDNGGEFIGYEFRAQLNQFGIKSKATTVKNPQANAVCERMHKTVADVLRTLIKDNPPKDSEEAVEYMDNALASTVHGLRCVINHTMKTSPGALVFQRDMLMDVPLVADLEAIRGRRQQQIDDNLRRTNKGRVDYNYQVGDMVKLKVVDPSKLEGHFKGPFKIIQVFTNGTVKLEIEPDVHKVFNIRKIQPIHS